ncbi:MAG TPA: LTA synthase family protein, partial [Fredinandcohnia sp.]|nr:LTA synthase family protein [Fredinandcohnia sp.]
ESLDHSLLGHREGGELVAPFLTALREDSATYRVRPIHDNGSADADFSMLTGRAPSPDVITYRLLHYPYGETLPKIFRRAGYHTESIHGLYGHFFGRQPVFAGPMGFDAVLFEKELMEGYGVRPGRWGIEDREMLDVAARRLVAHEGKIFQFVITLTSHGPFDYLDPKDEELFPGATALRQRYLNSMRYVDRALQAFYERLPEGTLLVVYGDHESGTEPPRKDAAGRRVEIVPYLVHLKGARLRAADPTLAESGELEQLDLVTYVRRYALSLAGG